MDKALELADVMEKYSVAGFQYPLCDEFKQAATMLRQQQAALIAEQEHNEMLEEELKAMREQLK